MSKNDIKKNRVVQDVRVDDSIYLPGTEIDGEAGVVRVSHEVWGPDHAIRRATRDNYVLIYVRSGSGVYAGEAGPVPVGPGWIFTFAPEHAHEVTCDRDDPLQLNRVTLVGAQTGRLFETHLGRRCHAWKLERPQVVSALLATMHQAARTGGGFVRPICNHYFRILLLTLHEDLAATRRHPSRAFSRFLQAKAWMTRHFDEGVGVVDAAAASGVRPEHLSRLFREYEKETPGRFLRQLRLNKAAHLLRQTSLPVGEVAVRVGIEDPFGFSRMFKRHFGLSPRAYRAG